MVEYNPLNICFEDTTFYVYDNQLYTKTFPKEWAKNYIMGTGPKYCHNCNEWGTWNGVFVIYCRDCAKCYFGERGGGCIDFFIKEGEHTYLSDPFAAMNTYMKDIVIEDIGNKNHVHNSGGINSTKTLYEITLENIQEIGNIEKNYGKRNRYRDYFHCRN